MRIQKLSIVAALVLGGLMAGSTLATAQDSATTAPKQGKRGAPSVDQILTSMTEQLTLTDEQKPKVKAVLEDSQKKRAELGQVAPEERREKFTALREEQTKKMKEILTPEQFAKYEKMPPMGRPARPGGAGGAAAGGDSSGGTKKD
jgi:Spy/CpxP family protein refolding chaperone